jgi:hypothetical protein
VPAILQQTAALFFACRFGSSPHQPPAPVFSAATAQRIVPLTPTYKLHRATPRTDWTAQDGANAVQQAETEADIRFGARLSENRALSRASTAQFLCLHLQRSLVAFSILTLRNPLFPDLKYTLPSPYSAALQLWTAGPSFQHQLFRWLGALPLFLLFTRRRRRRL